MTDEYADRPKLHDIGQQALNGKMLEWLECLGDAVALNARAGQRGVAKHAVEVLLQMALLRKVMDEAEQLLVAYTRVGSEESTR